MKKSLFARYLLLCLAALLCLCSMSACGDAKGDVYYGNESMAPGDAAPAPDLMDGTTGGGFSGGYAGDISGVEDEKGTADDPPVQAPANDLANRKIIKTAAMRGETLNFDEFMTALAQSISANSAYTESTRTESYKTGTQGADLHYAKVVIRVPADRYDAFTKNLDALCNLLDFEESVSDVTLEYVDVESRIKAYRAQETALLSMLEKAETVADLITVEGRLSEVRYEIESYQSRLNALSNMISYSTVTLDIYEVEKETVSEYPSVFGEIGAKFSENLADVGRGLREAFVFALSGVPYLLPLLALAGIAALVLVFALRRGKKKRKAAVAGENLPSMPPQE